MAYDPPTLFVPRSSSAYDNGTGVPEKIQVVRQDGTSPLLDIKVLDSPTAAGTGEFLNAKQLTAIGVGAPSPGSGGVHSTHQVAADGGSNSELGSSWDREGHRCFVDSGIYGNPPYSVVAGNVFGLQENFVGTSNNSDYGFVYTYTEPTTAQLSLTQRSNSVSNDAYLILAAALGATTRVARFKIVGVLFVIREADHSVLVVEEGHMAHKGWTDLRDEGWTETNVPPRPPNGVREYVRTDTVTGKVQTCHRYSSGDDLVISTQT